MSDYIHRRITVVCQHARRPHHGRSRVVGRLNWQIDAELERISRAAVDADPSRNRQAAELILLANRFDSRSQWMKRSGAMVPLQDGLLEVPLEGDSVGQANALATFRFQCDCGVTRLIRLDKMDAWVQEQVELAPDRSVYEFEIST